MDGEDTPAAPGAIDAALGALWNGKEAAGLRYEGLASFLVARAGDDLEAGSTLSFVFLDGIEIEGSGQ